jgi:hypothetical protein
LLVFLLKNQNRSPAKAASTTTGMTTLTATIPPVERPAAVAVVDGDVALEVCAGIV